MHDSRTAPVPGTTQGAAGSASATERLDEFFMLSPNPYVVLDPAWTLVACNPAYLAVTGRQAQDIIGANMFDAFPSDPGSASGSQLRESLERVVRDRVRDHLPLIRYDIRSPDGAVEERYWSATHTPVLDAQGAVAFVLQHTVDVTELQNLRRITRAGGQVESVQAGGAQIAESDVFARARAVQETNESLKDDLRRLQLLFDQAPGFVAVLSGPDHVFQLANDAYLSLIGRKNIIGKPIREALPEVAAQGFIDILDRVLATGEPFVGREARVVLRSGPDGELREYWLDFVYQPVSDKCGATSAIFVQGVDVTEQKRAVAALRESEARFRTIAESAPVMLWMGDADGSCLYLNRALRDFWGVDDDRLSSFDWSTTLHEEDRENLGAPFAMGMKERRAFQAEARYRRHDGVFRVLHTQAQPRFREDGAFLGMIGVNVDVTDTRAAEAALQDLNETLEEQVAQRTRELRDLDAALRQSQKMEVVGQLTGGIAHDFNNLLQIVSGNLEILQRNLPVEADRLRRAADNAMNGSRRAAQLTQRLLAFSRRQPLDPQPLNVNDLLSDMTELLHRTLGEAVSVETLLAAGLWQVEADANQLESAILNLALNARDAMPNGGRLTIETANINIDGEKRRDDMSPGRFVLIRVADMGVGMDRDTLEKVFEPFFTTKEVGKGTGLGLSMVYGFVKQSGGHVKIDSEPGRGATVEIYLPRFDGASRLQDAAPNVLAPPRSRDETILAVEDDDDVRSYSVEILRELGYTVLEAHDVASAMEILQTRRVVDLLFTDVILSGGETGAELARAAQRLRPDLKVLFTSGYAREVIVHRGRLIPGVDLVTKPFTYADLAQRIRTALDG